MVKNQEDEEMMELASCLGAICDPHFSKNSVAWFELHRAGVTRERLRETSGNPAWQGPKPFFENAPAYDSPMWLHLIDNAAREKKP